jgi:hypothetical protein
MSRIAICTIALFVALAPMLPVKADELPVKTGQNVPFCGRPYNMVPYLDSILVLHNYREADIKFNCGVIDGGLVDSVIGESDRTKYGTLKHVMIHTEDSRSKTFDVYIVIPPFRSTLP